MILWQLVCRDGPGNVDMRPERVEAVSSEAVTCVMGVNSDSMKTFTDLRVLVTTIGSALVLSTQTR